MHNYAYDANGNQTYNGAELGYDLADRLISYNGAGLEAPGPCLHLGETDYSYDGDGNRLSAGPAPYCSGFTTHYLWDSNNDLPQIALERNDSGAVIRRYAYGMRRISMNSGGSDFYYHYDTLGSATNLTNSTGASEWTYAYEPYGTTRNATQNDPNAPANPMQFTAEYLDPTGLYNLRAREYDPMLGRLLTLDRAEQSVEAPSIAGYVYAGDRPTVMVDPTGEMFEPASASRAAARSATSTGHVATGRSVTSTMARPNVSTLDPKRFPELSTLGFNLTKFLFGEIRGGRLVGVHFEGVEGGYLRGLERAKGVHVYARTAADSEGLYGARVYKDGAFRSKRSTFFPAPWTINNLLKELEYSMKPDAAGGGLYAREFKGGSLKFNGITRSGIEVEGFANTKYGLDTLYPLQKGS